MHKTPLIILAVVVLLVVGGGAFYGGTYYDRSLNKNSSANGNLQGLRGTRTGVNGGNFISGSIISADSDSITLQIPNNGGSKIVFYSATTQISKFVPGTSADLAGGTNVSVTGTTNSDGSITAQSIQIRPAGQNRIPGQ